jgi:hypothetical protein
MKAKIAAVIIFLFSAMVLGWVFLTLETGRRPIPVAAIAGAFGFVIAAAGVFLKPRLSYWLGMVSGLVSLYWFSRIEFSYFPALNSWITFNLPSDQPSILFGSLLGKTEDFACRHSRDLNCVLHDSSATSQLGAAEGPCSEADLAGSCCLLIGCSLVVRCLGESLSYSLDSGWRSGRIDSAARREERYPIP